jgi:putative peptidoglycan lipid II flippase
MWGTMISVALNVTLDYLFMKWIGVAGIALSTAVVYLVSFLFLSIMAARLLTITARDCPDTGVSQGN